MLSLHPSQDGGLRVLSLFAGIGGMDLGLERAGMEVVGQVEIDPFCLKVLEKHWPKVWRHNDVRTLTGEMVAQHCGVIDLICGGFPCQDISNAGKRAGIEGERSGLWAEYARVICEVRPKYVLVENVSALRSRGLGRVLGDLAESGYDAEWDCIPASALGAHHQRDRLFIVASRADTGGVRSQGFGAPTQGPWTREQFEGLVQTELRLSVPAGKSGGVSDGVPGRLHRLRGLGNAVVPQVAEFIGRSILRSAA